MVLLLSSVNSHIHCAKKCYVILGVCKQKPESAPACKRMYVEGIVMCTFISYLELKAKRRLLWLSHNWSSNFKLAFTREYMVLMGS